MPACSADEAAQLDSGNNTGGTGVGGTSSVIPGEVRFEADTPLLLAAKELAELSVHVEPNLGQLVTFDILSAPPDFDGFLLRGTSSVSSSGEASVELQAPSRQSEFVVRASLPNGAQASRTVRVNSTGYGTLELVPLYAGSRKIESWNVAVVLQSTCDEQESLWGPSAVTNDSDTPVLQSAPANTSLAVILRGDELVGGCVTIKDLAQDERRTVEVSVMDRPVAIHEGTVSLILGIHETFAAFSRHWDQAIQEGVAQFQGQGSSDADILLASMARQLSESDRVAFGESAETLGFSALIQQTWAEPAPLSARLTALLTESANSIGDASFSGFLAFNGEASSFFFEEIGGVTAETGGFEPEAIWVVNRGTGDELTFGGELAYSPLSWLYAIFEQNQGAPRLAEAARCSSVASALAAHSEQSLGSSCNETCLHTLCEDGMLTVLDALSFDSKTSIVISAAAQVKVGSKARVSSLSGTWIGRLSTSPDEEPQSAFRGGLLGDAVER